MNPPGARGQPIWVQLRSVCSVCGRLDRAPHFASSMDPSSVNMVDARNFEPTEVVVPNANAPRRVSLNAARPSPQSPPRASHRWPLRRVARASRTARPSRAPRVASGGWTRRLSDAARSPQVEPEMPIDPFQEGHAEKQIHTDFYQGFDTKDLSATDLS